jgi:hypothetical protein
LSEISFASIDAIAEQFADSDIYITTNYWININFGKYISPLSCISSSFIARLASKMYIENNFINPVEIQPLYVQDFVPR